MNMPRVAPRVTPPVLVLGDQNFFWCLMLSLPARKAPPMVFDMDVIERACREAYHCLVKDTSLLGFRTNDITWRDDAPPRGINKVLRELLDGRQLQLLQTRAGHSLFLWRISPEEAEQRLLQQWPLARDVLDRPARVFGEILRRRTIQVLDLGHRS